MTSRWSGRAKRDGFLDQVAGLFLVEFHRPGFGAIFEVCLIRHYSHMVLGHIFATFCIQNWIYTHKGMNIMVPEIF